MKRTVFTFLAALAFSATSFAQDHDSALDGNKIGVGADFMLPASSGFSEGYKAGFGGSVNYIHALSQKFKLTASAGFASFVGKEHKFTFLAGQTFTITPEKINFVPVKLGARYYVIDNLYFAGELGTAFLLDSKSSGVPFLYAPAVGVEFPVSNKMTVDLSGNYNGLVENGESIGFIGIRAALNFGL